MIEAVRYKHLLYGLSALVAAFWVAYLIFSITESVYVLSRDGVEAIGVVRSSYIKEVRRKRFRKSFYYKNEIEYDGHIKEFNLDRLYRAGTLFPVVYIRNDPDNALTTGRDDVVVYYIKNVSGLAGLSAILVLELALWVIALTYLRKAAKPNVSA
jgi:hypothetical protein